MSQAKLSDLNTNPDSRLCINRKQLIAESLAPLLTQTFGYNALLYSALAKQLCGEHLCIKNQITIGSPATDKQCRELSIICNFEELPIASDTIDLALLPDILQNSSNPHLLLREVERTLIPEGVAMLIGRNPFSWLGLKNKLYQRNKKNRTQGRDISRRRLADWFELLGFETENQITISVTNNRIQQSQAYPILKRISQYFCDYFCSYYIIIARKKVSTLTPIRPTWRRNKHLVPPRLAEPSVRHQVEDWFEQLK